MKTNAANSGAALWWVWAACTPAPPIEPPRPEVLVVTTTQPLEGVSHPPLQHGSMWRLKPRGPLRSDLASLLTGEQPPVHGVRHPVAHTLAIPLPPTRGSAEVLGEDWGFDTTATVTWMHVESVGALELQAWRREHPQGQLVVVGLAAERVLWFGEAPSWNATTVGLADVGAAIRAVQEFRPVPPLQVPAPGPAVVADRVVPWREREEASRLDLDVFRPEPEPRRTRDLLRVAEALDRRQLREASERLDALQQRSIDAPSIALRAELLTLQRQPHRAMELLEDRYWRSPSGIWALELGERWAALRSSRAEWWFREVLRLHPDQPDALLGLWRLDGQAEWLHHLWRVSPDHAMQAEAERRVDAGEPVWTVSDPHLEARARFQRGDAVGAIEELETLLAADPRSIPLRVEVARIALELGEPERVERLLAPVARWLPDDREVAVLMRSAGNQLAEERQAKRNLRWEWRRQR